MSRLRSSVRLYATPGGAIARRACADWSAGVVAVVVLLAAGFGYRVLASYLERAPQRVPILPGTLGELPLRIGDWVGRDEPVDEAVVRAADVDDYVNRLYLRKAGSQTIRLWIAFGIRARDLMPHRPEVCYPGAGWALRSKDTTVLRLKDGTGLQARILTFAPGGLDPRHLTVLNYYIVDGQTCEDVSLLRSKAWRGQAAVRYMAQIQIACRARAAGATLSPTDLVREFTTETFGLIRDLLDQAAGRAEMPEGRSES